MSIHITSPPHADQPEPEVAEPARRASRFDERGIALQTIIITVVMLAIAGAVAAVLFQRAGQETARLSDSESTSRVALAISTPTACGIAGHTWTTGSPPAGNDRTAFRAANPQLRNAFGFDGSGKLSATAHNPTSNSLGWCKPKP